MAKYKFDEVAHECRSSYKGDKSGVPIVGLEHIIPNEMLVKDYEVDTENTFTKSFYKGQILFGRRRAYQQKAAVATFDGICSGDITVIEPIAGKIEPMLLPFIIQNDRFFEHAVQGSAGSLSPRVKWEHLASFEVDLPSMEEQRILAEKLWSAYRLKESYKRLLIATQEMVKSQFIEMFGNTETKPLVDVCIKSGEYGSNTSAIDYNGITRYVRITDITDSGKLNDMVASPKKVEDKYRLNINDLLFARTGNTVGKTYLHKGEDMIFAGYLIRYKLNERVMLPQFAFSYTHTQTYYNWVEKTKKVGAQPNISATQYDEMPIPVPPMEQQQQFVTFAEHADKSVFEIKKSIEAIDAVIKSLING